MTPRPLPPGRVRRADPVQLDDQCPITEGRCNQSCDTACVRGRQ